jgi:predicted RNase H-like HicB family nuclease
MDNQARIIPISDDLEEAIQTVYICPCCGSPTIMVPRLMCKRCMKDIEIKAFVYKRGGVFYGECLTLNLVSRGDTQEEAIRRLQIAMFSYVHTVLSSEQSCEGLIPRSAPFISWVRYYSDVMRARVSYLFGIKYRLATNVFQTSIGDDTTIAHC